MRLKLYRPAAIAAVVGLSLLAGVSANAQSSAQGQTCERPANALPLVNVYFQSGSSDLGDESIVAGIDYLAKITRLADTNGVSLMVVGYSANTPEDKKVPELSVKRANAVKDALVARGIPVSRVKILARGGQCQTAARPGEYLPMEWLAQKAEVFFVPDQDAI